MQGEVEYGVNNPSCCLNHTSLPRRVALIPGVPIFWPLTKSLLELHMSLLLGS